LALIPAGTTPTTSLQTFNYHFAQTKGDSTQEFSDQLTDKIHGVSDNVADAVINSSENVTNAGTNTTAATVPVSTRLLLLLWHCRRFMSGGLSVLGLFRATNLVDSLVVVEALRWKRQSWRVQSC
jgi:hypothetical protein